MNENYTDVAGSENLSVAKTKHHHQWQVLTRSWSSNSCTEAGCFPW